MDLDALAQNSIGQTASQNASLSGSGQTIAENFQTFLGLLTTQLQNQSPLDPLDTNQFTQQLVQFTSVEQQLKTNDFLEALITSTQNDSQASAIGYIGKTIQVKGNQSELQDGQAKWGYELKQDAQITAYIYDENGKEVYTESSNVKAGQHTFDWEGNQSVGGTAPDGTYTIKLYMDDGNGNKVLLPTKVEGEVTSVDFSGNTPTLYVGDIGVKLNDVTRVSI